ncbi:MAG: signal peptide peptidase SppA [Spirochaetota bacterium]|jgi:protease-4|nr:signal peptide peptidase SppA [Spirochaetota bacterium]
MSFQSKDEGDDYLPQRKRDTAARLLAFAFFLSFAAGLILVLGGERGSVSGDSAALGPERPGIAVFDINGAISFDEQRSFMGFGQRGAASIAETIRHFSENKLVRGLVLRINSPGGSVAATQEIYNAVKRFRESGKPVVVSMGDVAASGGYYVACAASSIFANPGSITGSIGVIMSAPNLSGLYDWAHIEWNVIKSGRFKDIMSPFRAMTEEERKLLGEMIQDAYLQFFDAVHGSREITREKLESLAQGQVFSGRQALAEGLIDDVGDFEAALLEAAKLAGIAGRPYLIYEKQSYNLLDLLGMGAALARGEPRSLLPGLDRIGRQSILPPLAYLMPGAPQ